MLSQEIVNICYLVAAVLFILDLKWMAHPRTAARGNLVGAVAMVLAVAATLLSAEYELGWGYIVGGVAVVGFPVGEGQLGCLDPGVQVFGAVVPHLA